MSVGDRDDLVRRYELERLERAVDDLRAQGQRIEERRAEIREADNARHSAEHDAIEARIERERERHASEHKAEQQDRAHRGEWTWTRVVGVIALALTLFGLELQYVASHK